MKYDLELDVNSDNSLLKIIKQIKPNTTVLEFGPAMGRMTKYLKEKLNCTMYFVEIDPDAGNNVMQFAKDGIIGDIEEFSWIDKFSGIEFDYIIFADVLEHLRNPQLVLTNTNQLLREDGSVIISVPNIAHNSILINLNNNIFNYTSLGLLDNTHIHLFAYNNLIEFCLFSGYIPVIEDATYSEVGTNEVNCNYDNYDKDSVYALKSRRYGNIYQFLFTLKKSSYIKSNNVQIIKKIIPYYNNYFYQVFYDIGNGWCEENSIKVMFNPMCTTKIQIDLSDIDNIKNIRIDPINVNCIMKISNIFIIYKDMLQKESEYYSNANFACESFLIFNHDDPQIYLNSLDCKEVSHIIINCEFNNVEYNSSIYMKSLTEKLVNQKETIQSANTKLYESIETYNKQINMINLNYIEQKEILEQRETRLNLLENLIKEQENLIKEQEGMLINERNKINDLNNNIQQLYRKDNVNIFRKLFSKK